MERAGFYQPRLWLSRALPTLRDAITDANLFSWHRRNRPFTVPDAEASYKIVSDLPVFGEISVGYGKELLYLIFPNCQVPFARFHELPPST